MEVFYFNSKNAHANNTQTMDEFLDNYFEDLFDEDDHVVHRDGSYAEVRCEDGAVYGLHASGNGNFNEHKVEFEIIN